jgi:predicted transglutaminase-like cysteine proteinase
VDFGGWVALKTRKTEPKWDAVKDTRVPAIEPKTVHDIHIWVRRHITYCADREDLWAQPFETLGCREGDCEDISILERALLIAAGFDSAAMWLVLAYDQIARVDHALLVYDKFLIDSRTDRITYVADAKDYRPVIAFCDDDTYIFGRRL